MEQTHSKARRVPRKMTERRLENIALHYLKRYSATTTQLRRVLSRRISRAARAHGQEVAEAKGWLDALVEKLVRNGLLNDETWARSRAQSLRESGKSGRMIALKLRTKGISQAVAEQHVRRATESLSDEDAARIHARKKRLGPFRKSAEIRRDKRQRDLAALARAGFSYAVARKVIDGAL